MVTTPVSRTAGLSVWTGQQWGEICAKLTARQCIGRSSMLDRPDELALALKVPQSSSQPVHQMPRAPLLKSSAVLLAAAKSLILKPSAELRRRSGTVRCGSSRVLVTVLTVAGALLSCGRPKSPIIAAYREQPEPSTGRAIGVYWLHGHEVLPRCKCWHVPSQRRDRRRMRPILQHISTALPFQILSVCTCTYGGGSAAYSGRRACSYCLSRHQIPAGAIREIHKLISGGADHNANSTTSPTRSWSRA